MSKYTSKILNDLFDSFVNIHYVESGSKGNTQSTQISPN